MSQPDARGANGSDSRATGKKRAGMHLFNRKVDPKHTGENHQTDQEKLESGESQEQQQHPSQRQPTHDEEGYRINHNGHRVMKGLQPDGESGRRGVHPWHFVRICWKSSSHLSMWTNVLWPFTIAAFVLRYGFSHERHLWVFITSYIGMVAPANLLGFAGQELARKIPKVLGVILETTFGSIVELILFMVLISRGERFLPVIRAAILGSILANMLLCLGLCFFVGGLFHPQQVFHEAISEVGSNVMLVAGMGLVIPTIFYNSLTGRLDEAQLEEQALHISEATAIILLIAFVVYVWFQCRSHHGLYEDILEADEERDHDRHLDLAKPKLTLTESAVAVAIALTFVAFMAIFLVDEIGFMVEERHVSDAFMGLILVPVVEKASEHLTAVDEAYDNQMNFAIAHVLGASIQTALLTTPLVVLVGWGINNHLSLNFELFDAVVLILAIIVVGNFLRDEKSDYLEGALSVFVYVLIAVTAFFYPNPQVEGGTSSAETNPTNSTLANATTSAVAAARVLF